MSKIQCVYKIECLYESVKECYIGSSTDLNSRIRCHKSNCNNCNGKEYNLKVYDFIRSRGGWEYWTVSIIKEYPGFTKEQLQIPEQEQIDLLKPTLNSNNAYTTVEQRVEQHKEYRKLNKDKIVEQRKEHYKQNKDKIKEQQNQNYKQNKEEIKAKRLVKIECDKCGSIVRKTGIIPHKKSNKCINYIPQNLNKDKLNSNASIKKQYNKKYRENHKEEANDYRKKYNELNKEELNAKASIKIECDKCGSIVRKCGIIPHKKSNKCINYIPQNLNMIII